MRVWIDITNSPHVLFFRPLIELLEAEGHEVEVTARDYAQTLELLDRHGIAHHVVGPAHGSHELTLVARSLGIPSATAHDYEFATLQHQLGLRAATRVVFPEA